MRYKRLNILITADPEIPVPPEHYGGIERIVDILVKGLICRGHKVYLFAHPGSATPAEIIPYNGKKSRSFAHTIQNALQVRRHLDSIGDIDIVHSFSRLAYLLFLAGSKVPKIQSYQRHITPKSIKLGSLLMGKTLSFTACSNFCISPLKRYKNKFKVIPNGVEVEKYNFVASVSTDAPLVFLGRIEKIKGPHIAIEAAKKTGKKLVIAGNHANSGKNYRYFKESILPQCDGKTIKYIGPVNDSQKNQLLGQAQALLFPIMWDEPFGIVMVEALACGTPVIAFNRGAVPEVVSHGKTGFICDPVNKMVEAVENLDKIKRFDCRKLAEKKFSDKIIVNKYENLYYDILKKHEFDDKK